MATVESLSNNVTALTERTATLETELRVWTKVITAITSVACLAALSALAWGVHLGSKVTAIEQQLSDGGSAKIVAQIQVPQSPAQLQAALSTVVAQIQTAAVSGKKPDLAKAENLSRAVSQAIQRNPDLPDAWRAGSALINLRPAVLNESDMPLELAALEGPPTQNLGFCYDRPMSYFDPPKPEPIDHSRVVGISLIALHDCTITLDDVQGFLDSPQVRHSKTQMSLSAQQIPFLLDLVRVRVIYHGGPIIPVAHLNMYGCTFIFDVPVRPPSNGQMLVQQLLTTKITKGDVTLTLPLG